MEIELFIGRLNNCYIDRGHYFKPIISQNCSNAEIRNQELADSSIALFIIDTDRRGRTPVQCPENGESLKEAYKAARERYNKTGMPRIAIYVKQDSESGEDESGKISSVDCAGAPHRADNSAYGDAAEVTDAVKTAGGKQRNAGGEGTVNTELRIPNSEFYHNTYINVDTIKLGILMQIKQLDLDGIDIRLENGKVWQGSDVLLLLDNVESVTGFETLQQLKQKHAELEGCYYTAKARFAGNPDDAAVYEAFVKASQQRNDAIKEIHNIEEQLYHMIEGMFEHTSHGKLSKRQSEGYRLIECGKFKEAKAVLDLDEIIRESRHDMKMIEKSTKNAQIHVNELLQLKDVNATLLDWKGADACFREAVHLEEAYNLPRNATVEYIEFLVLQYQYAQAAGLGEKLCNYYESQGSGISDVDKAYLYNMLGIIYMESQRMSEAEEMLNASLELRRNRVEGDPDVIGKDIAISYNNLGNLYFLTDRYTETIDANKSALEIREKLMEYNPDRYMSDLGLTYINLGEAYNEVEKYIESADLMMRALDIFKRLAINIPDPNEEYLSLCYENLGVSYAQLGRYDEAEEQFNSALEIQIKLAGINPDAYEPRAAECCREFGRSYFEAKRYPEAEDKFKTALELYKKLASRSPDAFEPELANICSNMGELYTAARRYAEAEDALNSALTLYRKYMESNPALIKKAASAKKHLDSLSAALRRQDTAYSLLTPEEKEIALLLTDGVTRHEIARKLHMSAAEVANSISIIREKVVSMADSDPVIASVVHEYKLTRREADMLRYLRYNSGNDIITAELFLSEETVRIHIRNLLKKLDLENRQDVSDWLESYNVRWTGSVQ
jgi:DNA-binding NarL/FixJ family response regulator